MMYVFYVCVLYAKKNYFKCLLSVYTASSTFGENIPCTNIPYHVKWWPSTSDLFLKDNSGEMSIT